MQGCERLRRLAPYLRFHRYECVSAAGSRLGSCDVEFYDTQRDRFKSSSGSGLIVVVACAILPSLVGFLEAESCNRTDPPTSAQLPCVGVNSCRNARYAARSSAAPASDCFVLAARTDLERVRSEERGFDGPSGFEGQKASSHQGSVMMRGRNSKHISAVKAGKDPLGSLGGIAGALRLSEQLGEAGNSEKASS